MTDFATLSMLNGLSKTPAYLKLMELWLEDVNVIEGKRDSAASRGQESAWRYFAGLEKGYKQAMMRLHVEITKMEEEGGDLLSQPSEKVARFLDETRGEKQT